MTARYIHLIDRFQTVKMSVSKIISSLLLSLHLLLCILVHSVHSFSINFAAHITLKHFPTCSIIIVTSYGNPSDLSEVSDLELKFKHGVPTEIPPSSHHILGLVSQNSSLDGGRDMHKLTPYCRTIITFANGATFNTPLFKHILIPREFPITFRDVDHYIFLTGATNEEENLAKAILLSDVGPELKYKILALANQSKLLTFCLYCPHTVQNPRGSDAVLEIMGDETSDKATLFPTFTKNLNRHLMKVVGPSKYVSLYEMERINGSKWYEHKRGLFKEFFFIMQGKLNFSYLLRPCSGFGNIVPEGNTGTMLKNGTWAGCVGDIYYSWADLSMGGSPAGDRLHYVDFSTNMRYDYVQFFTHGPRTVYPWTIAFVCFDLYGWGCVLLSLVFACLLLYTTENFMGIPGPKIGDVILYLYAYLVGQELCVEPRSISSKLVFINWMYYGIVVGAAYACSLQSLIVSPGQSMVPYTMSELAHASSWSCGVPLSFRNGLAENTFKKSTNPDMRKLYRETQEDKNAMECLRRAAVEDYACFHWQIMAEFYMGTIFIDRAGNHPFLFAKDYILFSGPTWMVRKREIWKDTFNDFFGRQFSMGIVYETSAQDRRMVRRQLIEEVRQGKRKPLQSYTSEDDGPKPFTWENVQAGFIVLAIGLVWSTFAYVHEVFPKFCVVKIKLDWKYWIWMLLNCRKVRKIRRNLMLSRNN